MDWLAVWLVLVALVAVWRGYPLARDVLDDDMGLVCRSVVATAVGVMPATAATLLLALILALVR